MSAMGLVAGMHRASGDRLSFTSRRLAGVSPAPATLAHHPLHRSEVAQERRARTGWAGQGRKGSGQERNAYGAVLAMRNPTKRS